MRSRLVFPRLAFPRRLTTRVVALLCVASVAIVGRRRGRRDRRRGAASSGHDNTVFAFGTASFHGSTAGKHLNAPIVGMASTPSGKGYWLVANDGGVFTFNAPFFGSLGARHLNSPIVGMAATPTGKGYWLVAGDGGVFTFGDAKFYGSTGAMHLNSPITQIIAGPARQGLLADGDRRWRVHVRLGASSTARWAAKRLNAPIVGMNATPSGRGYLLVASDGGVFTFGNAKFHGSTGSLHVTSPVVGIAGTSTGGGYWLATQNGSVYNFGDAKKQGGAMKHALADPPDHADHERSRQRRLPPARAARAADDRAAARARLDRRRGRRRCRHRLLALGYWLPGVDGIFEHAHRAGRVRVPEVQQPAAHRRGRPRDPQPARRRRRGRSRARRAAT